MNKLMKCVFAVVLAVVVAGVNAETAHAADTVRLAENGKALATIEVAPDASIATRSVAQELANYLDRISGASFEVAQQPGVGSRIILGQASEFPAHKAEDALRGKGAESFVMRTTGDRVLLLGQGQSAVSYAAYAFLESLGVRWFFPTSAWEVVPEMKMLTVQLDEVQSPDMPYHRSIWYGNMNGYHPANFLGRDWMRRNRMEPDGPETGHSWIGLDPKKDFAEHPEWFALVGDKRRNTKPNYGHPEVVRIAVERALKEAVAGAKSITVSAPDGGNFCECDLCLQVAGVERSTLNRKKLAIFGTRPDGTEVCVTSETIFRMANIVAEAVSKKYPDVLIGVLAYSGYSHPPSFNMHPNVYVSVTSGYRRTPLTYDEQIRIFGEKTKQMGVYEYYHLTIWHGYDPDKGPKMSDLRERMGFYHANGVSGVNAEATNNWAPAGLDYYIASKLMWDAEADVDALYADFLDNAFGAAKVPMKSYYDRWEAKTALDLGSISEATTDLIAAYRLADTPETKNRVAQLYLYNRFLRLGEEYKQAKDDPEKASVAGQEYADLFWRLKDAMLLHDTVTRGVNRPMVPAFTATELDKMMADDAAWVKKNRAQLLTFSRNLVPVTMAAKAVPGVEPCSVDAGRFREGKMVVWAKAGETVEVGISPTNETASYKVAFISSEQFQAGAGADGAAAVTSGNASDKITFRAQETGYYWLTWNEAGISSVSHSHALEGGEQKLTGATFYFYVPPGTTEFTLAARAQGGPTLTMRDANGKTAYELKGYAVTRETGADRNIETVITVPEGAGGVWSLTGPADTSATSGVTLSGIPQFLSFSPQLLLVAEEYLN